MRRHLVGARSISLASASRRKFAHFAAPPLPTETTSLGFGGDPSGMISTVAGAKVILTRPADTRRPAALCLPGTPAMRRHLVGARSISLASASRRKFAHFAAPPLPTETTSLGFGGDPSGMISTVAGAKVILTRPADTRRPAALCLPGTPAMRRHRWRCGSSCRRSPAAPQPPRCRRRR